MRFGKLLLLNDYLKFEILNQKNDILFLIVRVNCLLEGEL